MLGDIGRSPRMCFHVESLANEGYKVAIVGYPGSALLHHYYGLHQTASSAVTTSIHRKAAEKSFHSSRTIQAPSPSSIAVLGAHNESSSSTGDRLGADSACASYADRGQSSSSTGESKGDYRLAQFGIHYFGVAIRREKSMGEVSREVGEVEWEEAFAHLFVTHAMKSYLEVNWGLEGEKRVLHDRPPKHFRRARLEESHRLLGKLVPHLQPPVGEEFLENSVFTKKIRRFTRRVAGEGGVARV